MYFFIVLLFLNFNKYNNYYQTSHKFFNQIQVLIRYVAKMVIYKSGRNNNRFQITEKFKARLAMIFADTAHPDSPER